jgi:cbb3-type cytochrome oxidase maturation protein
MGVSAGKGVGLRGHARMNMLIYLIPIALSMGALGLVAFLWSLRSGQYDDLEGAAWRVLADDDLDPPKS